MKAWIRKHGETLDRLMILIGLTAAVYAAFTASAASDSAGRATKAVAAQAAHAAAESRRTHEAICAFRQDLVDRARGTEEFLKTHPSGFGDISRTEIEVNLANQRRTIHSLRGARCSA